MTGEETAAGGDVPRGDEGDEHGDGVEVIGMIRRSSAQVLEPTHIVITTLEGEQHTLAKSGHHNVGAPAEQQWEVLVAALVRLRLSLPTFAPFNSLLE